VTRLRLLIFVLLAILPPLAVFAGLGWLLATEDGARWLLQKQLPRWTDQQVQIESVEGRLINTISVEGMVVRDLPGGDAEIDALALDWEPLGLLGAAVRVERLEGRGIRIPLAPKGAEPTETGPRQPITLPDLDLPVSLDLQSVQLEDVRIGGAEEGFQLDRLALSAEVGNGEATIHQFALRLPDASLDLEGTTGTTGDWPLDLAANWEFRPGEGPRLAGSGTLGGNVSRIRLDHQLSAPASVATRGEIRPLMAVPRFDLTGEWQAIPWPLDADPQITAEEGSYHLEGSIERFEIGLDSDVTGPRVPPAHVSITASGSPESLALQPVRIETLEGSATVRGDVELQPVVSWDLRTIVEGLNPGSYAAQWPGVIEGEILSRGSLAERADMELTVERLKGTLRGYPLEARGEARLEGDQWQIPDVRLDSGRSRVRASGMAGPSTLALDWKIRSPDMGELLPNLRGELEAEGEVRGSPDSPAVTATLEGRSIAAGPASVQRLSGRIDVALASPDSANIQVSARDLVVADRAFDEARLRLQPSGDRQLLSLDLLGEADELHLHAAGRLSENRWEGALEQLSLRTPESGLWELEAPTPFAVSPEQARLSEACLLQDPARLCLQGDWKDDGTSELGARLERLPVFDRLKPWLPAGVEGQGQANGELKLRYASERDLNGHWLLEMPEGVLAYSDAEGASVEVPLAGIRTEGELTGRTITARTSAGIGEQGRIRGEARLTRPETVGWDQARLEGSGEAELPDLSWVQAFAPRLRETEASLEAEAVVDGRVSEPAVTASARLEGQTRLPELGLDLEDIQVEARAQPDGEVSLKGSVRSGPGTLQFDGQMIRVAGQPEIRLAVSGEQVEIADNPEARIQVSPFLALQVVPGEVHVNGNVDVDLAHIRVKELPEGAVEVSEDEIIVRRPAGEAEEAAREEPPLKVFAHIRVDLGEDVRFEGFGFESRLGGGLMVSQRPDQGLLADGEIRIIEGRYTAYGQKLTVRDGRVIFAGVATNPALDVRATRTVKDVTAGIHVGGTLQSPATTLFSQPPMDDGNILSYIVLGRPLGEAGGSERGLLTRAAYGLGLKQGDLLAQRIGTQLGFDEVGVSTENGLEAAAFVIGKYLAPDLYLRYAMGVFDAENRVELDYRVSERISVEAQSGSEGGVDVFYTIEKD